MGYDSLIHNYQENELSWQLCIVTIGFANEVHALLIMSYAAAFAMKYDDPQKFAEFTCFVMGVSIFARSVNATFWLTYDHRPRILNVCLAILVAYGLVIFAYINPFWDVTLSLISLAVVISTFAAKVGEAAILGYIKGVPPELTIYYVMGKSSARCFSVFALTLMNYYGIEMMKYFFFSMLLVGPYIICFEWVDERRMEHNEHSNFYKLKSRDEISPFSSPE